jgi:hypothetical protein
MQHNVNRLISSISVHGQAVLLVMENAKISRRKGLVLQKNNAIMLARVKHGAQLIHGLILDAN